MTKDNKETVKAPGLPPVIRTNKSPRRRPRRFIKAITMAMARAAALATKHSGAVTFTRELEEARTRGQGRQYRHLHADWRTDVQSRFGAISVRSSYERRRGRC